MSDVVVRVGEGTVSVVLLLVVMNMRWAILTEAIEKYIQLKVTML